MATKDETKTTKTTKKSTPKKSAWNAVRFCAVPKGTAAEKLDELNAAPHREGAEWRQLTDDDVLARYDDTVDVLGCNQ